MIFFNLVFKLKPLIKLNKLMSKLSTQAIEHLLTIEQNKTCITNFILKIDVLVEQVIPKSDKIMYVATLSDRDSTHYPFLFPKKEGLVVGDGLNITEIFSSESINTTKRRFIIKKYSKCQLEAVETESFSDFDDIINIVKIGKSYIYNKCLINRAR